MPFKHDIHCRRSIRLAEYDYSSSGGYFVTLVSWQREMLFGEVVGGEMLLNQIGKIVYAEWIRSGTVRDEVTLDEFLVMPNHLHGIIFLHNVGATGRSPLPQYTPRGPKPKSLGALIAGFKSSATTKINRFRGTPGCPVWQRNYYDHIIRDDKDLEQIRQYIRANPLLWDEDQENPDLVNPN